MSRHPCLLWVCLFFQIFFRLDAQDEAVVKSIIGAGDLKKLGKANAYKEDGDKLIEEANTLNMEVFTVQANLELDEKTIKRKSEQLETQAKQKQIQASGLYEKCNEIKFAVYKKYLDAFWKDHSGEETSYLNAKLLEEQSSDNYFQAASYRIDAKRMDDDNVRIEKLTEANDLEAQAIQKQLTALAEYYRLDLSVNDSPEVATPELETDFNRETTVPQRIEINQEMIDRYNRYMADDHPVDTAISTGRIAAITEFDRDNMLRIWYAYLNGRDISETDVALAESADSATAVPDKMLPGAEVAEEAKPMEIGIITDENKDKIIPADEEVIYRVQVAANRNELSQRALGKMYYGNKRVEMINENGWYKYSVGDFSSYEEASRFRQESGVSNAYIVAYRKGTRFEQGPVIDEIKPQTAYTPEGGQRMPEGLVFRIQVAASRVPVTQEQLKRIYGGKYPVEMVSEEGWYKYQLMGVRLYSDAQEILKNVQVGGGFIVAYENGFKVNLAEAVARNRELEKTVQSKGRKGLVNEIEYHLQIAASRIPMKQDELRALYGGPEAISVILEDGWYKYHLKAGNAPGIAEQFKKDCAIDKAFIVPYRRAAKITYFEAIQDNK